ncbi:MAG: NlpC/P60 family protein [Eubacteriales bacterium]|nr:NlpC/P60 family protein [Eubacteriales bacterium]
MRKGRISCCLFGALFAVLMLLASRKDVSAASARTYQVYCPLVQSNQTIGYDEDYYRIGNQSKVKSVKWTINRKDIAAFRYEKKSCFATLVFKKTGTVKITRTVKTSKSTVKTNYIVKIFNKNTWAQIDGRTYYLLKDGGYAEDQWIGDRYVNTYNYWDKKFIKTGDGIRYKKSDGSYAANEWITSDDYCEYYFGSNGLMVTNGWIEGYYLQKDGKKMSSLRNTADGWKVIDSFNSSEYEDEDGEIHYEELYLKNVWRTVNGKTVYFGGDERMVKNQWKTISNKTYYFDENGYMAVSSWIDGYYVDEQGVRVKNKRVGDYFVGKDGKKAVGKWINGYYVDGSGKIVKNRWIKGSYVGLNGKKVKKMKVTSGKVAVNGSCLYSNKKELDKLVAIAKKELGKPYIWGGNGPEGYDCSGFVNYCYRTLGYTIPRTSYYAADTGVKIDPNDISEWQTGDLLVRRGDINGGSMGHIIMYIGDGKVIQSTRAGAGGVQLGLAETYVGEYTNIRRILYVK